MLSTFWRISLSSKHFFHKYFFTYITFTIHIIGHSGYFFHILIWAYRFTGTSTNPSAICQNSSASMLAALAQYSISVRMKIRKIFRCKNRGPGVKNRKSILKKSKLEYYKAFWLKIQKFKILGKNLKIRGLGTKKPKNNLKYLKTRVLQDFLGENPKIEIF